MKRMKGKKKEHTNTIQYDAVFLGGCYEIEKKGTKQMQIIGHDWTQL